MTDTATPETGPVDAPASFDSILDEFEAGGEAPGDALDEITDQMVNEADGEGDSDKEPGTEDDATDPADDDAGDEDGNPDEQIYTVKVNGEEREVPLSELLKGYSRTEDYKAKTTAVAEERRAIEAQRANLDAEVRSQYANQLEEATNIFAQYDPVLMEARQINWEALKATDPAAYVQAQDAVQTRLNAIQQMKQQVEANRTQAQQALEQRVMSERAERFDSAANEIIKAIPELADEAKFQSFATEAVDFLRGEGFNNDEIADTLDARVLKLADKARRWDAHVAAQKSLPEKKVVPKSALKSLTSDGRGARSQQSRFPSRADRDVRGDWIVNQLLSQE